MVELVNYCHCDFISTLVGGGIVGNRFINYVANPVALRGIDAVTSASMIEFNPPVCGCAVVQLHSCAVERLCEQCACD